MILDHIWCGHKVMSTNGQVNSISQPDPQPDPQHILKYALAEVRFDLLLHIKFPKHTGFPTS